VIVPFAPDNEKLLQLTGVLDVVLVETEHEGLD
jgi:hypothetical protein